MGPWVTGSNTWKQPHRSSKCQSPESSSQPHCSGLGGSYGATLENGQGFQLEKCKRDMEPFTHYYQFLPIPSQATVRVNARQIHKYIYITVSHDAERNRNPPAEDGTNKGRSGYLLATR